MSAQKLWTQGEFTGTKNAPRWAKFADFDGSIIFCRGYFEGADYNSGIYGWWTDYPGLDQNLLVRLSELTVVRTRVGPDKQPVFVVIKLDDPLISRCPVLFMSDPTALNLSEHEARNLRQYLARGGFIWFDDFWGSSSFEHWEQEMRKITPEPAKDIPASHPIMSMLYRVEGVPQIPNVGFWNLSGRQTSEQGEDSATVHFRGIQDSRGRLMVVATHNTDIGDSIEEEKSYSAFGRKFSSTGYSLAINIFLYALLN